MAFDDREAHTMPEALFRHPALTAQIAPTPHTLAFNRTIAGGKPIAAPRSVHGVAAVALSMVGRFVLVSSNDTPDT